MVRVAEKGWRRSLSLLAVLGMAGMAACQAAAETATILTTDAYGQSSLTNASNWSTGVAPTDAAAKDVDFVLNKNTMRTPLTGDWTSPAKSMAVDGGLFVLANNGQAGARIAFANPLTFRRGNLANFYVHGSFLDADVVLDCPNGFTVFAEHSCRSKETDFANVVFTGDFFGEADSTLCFRQQYGPSATCDGTNATYRIDGSLSECRSTFDLKVLGYTDDVGDTNLVLRLTTATNFPGTLKMGRNTALDLTGLAVPFAVSNLSMDAMASVRLAWSCADAAGGTVCVRDRLSVAGRPRIDVVCADPFASDGSAFRHPLLKAPAGTGLSVETFRVAPPPGFMLSVADDADGCPTLWMERAPVVSLTTADAVSARESYAPNGLAHSWSDGEWPHPGAVYLVDGKLLRTPVRDTTTQSRCLAFGGDALILKDLATLAMRGHAVTGRIVCVSSSSAKVPCITHYATGDTTLFPHCPSGVGVVAGDVRLCAESGGGAQFIVSTGRGLRIDAEIHGNGDMRLAQSQAENANPPQPVGYFHLNAVNTNLFGKVRMCAVASTWKPTTGDHAGGSYPVPSEDFSPRVWLSDPRNLGGPLQAPDRRNVVVGDYVRIHPMTSMAFDDMTRGWSIGSPDNEGIGKSYFTVGTARLYVTNGVTVTFRQPLNFCQRLATLVKEGEGTLELGSPAPTFWVEGNPEGTASESNNLFRVKQGTVRFLSGMALDGLHAFVSPNATLAFDAHPSDETLLAYGVYNDVVRRERDDRSGSRVFQEPPFELDDGALEIAVRIEDAGRVGKPPRRLPLFTVGAEHADALRSSLRLSHPFRGYRADFYEETFDAPKHGGLLTTIGVGFTQGMLVILK